MAPAAPMRPALSRKILAGSGTGIPGTPTSLPSLPASRGTFWNLTKIALQISSSVKPAKAAPETVNEALSPGNNPSATEPPEKVGPVIKAKSSPRC